MATCWSTSRLRILDKALALREVRIARDELTFNWPARPQQVQVWNYMANFRSERRPTTLWGGKGEGVALSPHATWPLP